MNNKKAEEEVSVIITGITLLGLLTPALLIWIVRKFSVVTSYLAEVGVLERGNRVIWRWCGEIGLDQGRIAILTGVILLVCASINSLFKKYINRNK